MHQICLTVETHAGPPEVEESSDIQKLFNEVGVGYTHRNDHLIRSNAIEELRVEALIEVHITLVSSLFSAY